MCIKVDGLNELGTVKALMSMSLNLIIEDVFDIDSADIKPELNLRDDLLMNENKQQQLASAIADYFDGSQPDLKQVETLDQLYNLVVNAEFAHIPEEAFSI